MTHNGYQLCDGRGIWKTSAPNSSRLENQGTQLFQMPIRVSSAQTEDVALKKLMVHSSLPADAKIAIGRSCCPSVRLYQHISRNVQLVMKLSYHVQ